MSRFSRLLLLALWASLVLVMSPADMNAQGRGVRRHPPHPARATLVRGQVFIGGYFYDPFFGPYPWWPRTAYPYWYVPRFDSRAEVRIQVVPDEADRAAVYVDGFYAGIVNDFDGVLQALPLTPGGHTLVLYLEGYRTVRHNFYLSPGSTYRIRQTMERMPGGVKSELPELAPPVPAPPAGSYRMPTTMPEVIAGQRVDPGSRAVGFGTLDVFVQPIDAEVLIDGQPWATSDQGHFVVQVPSGKHRVEIRKRGYRQFVTEVDVSEGESTPLNVSLMIITT